MSEDTLETLRAQIINLERQVSALRAENAALKGRSSPMDDELLAVNQLAFEQIPVSLDVFRADGLLVSVNAVEALFGVSRHLQIGIVALRLIRRHGKSVRHLRFDE